MGIVIFDDKIEQAVLVMENDSEIVFPKGHVEFGEDHIDTVIREMREETGIFIERSNCAGKINEFEFYFEGENAIKVIEVYLFKIQTKQEPHPNTAEGINSAYWLSTPEALKRLTHDDARNSLHTALTTLGGPTPK